MSEKTTLNTGNAEKLFLNKSANLLKYQTTGRWPSVNIPKRMNYESYPIIDPYRV